MVRASDLVASGKSTKAIGSGIVDLISATNAVSQVEQALQSVRLRVPTIEQSLAKIAETTASRLRSDFSLFHSTASAAENMSGPAQAVAIDPVDFSSTASFSRAVGMAAMVNDMSTMRSAVETAVHASDRFAAGNVIGAVASNIYGSLASSVQAVKATQALAPSIDPKVLATVESAVARIEVTIPQSLVSAVEEMARQAQFSPVAAVNLPDCATLSGALEGVADRIQELTSVPASVWSGREELYRRVRIKLWLEELGCDDDPGSIALIEMDGIERGHNYRNYWFEYLGTHTKQRPTGEDAKVLDLEGGFLCVWGVRIYHDDLDAFAEIRFPPWGTGAHVSVQGLDPFRPADGTRILGGLGALGFGRKRGRKSLDAVWSREDFYRRYLAARAVAKNPRAGRPPRDLDIAIEMSIDERHLRRLIRLHGRPD